MYSSCSSRGIHTYTHTHRWRHYYLYLYNTCVCVLTYRGRRRRRRRRRFIRRQRNALSCLSVAGIECASERVSERARARGNCRAVNTMDRRRRRRQWTLVVYPVITGFVRLRFIGVPLFRPSTNLGHNRRLHFRRTVGLIIDTSVPPPPPPRSVAKREGSYKSTRARAQR